MMEAWVDNPNITALVAPLFPGEQTGPGSVDVLWGHVSPSGKLPFTSSYYLPDTDTHSDTQQLAKPNLITLPILFHTITAFPSSLISPRSLRLITDGLTRTTSLLDLMSIITSR